MIETVVTLEYVYNYFAQSADLPTERIYFNMNTYDDSRTRHQHSEYIGLQRSFGKYRTFPPDQSDNQVVLVNRHKQNYIIITTINTVKRM